MIDNISVRRFLGSTDVADCKPKDCLTTVINDIDTENIQSVYVIAVDNEGDIISYRAGPDIATFRKGYTLLQEEILRIIAQMFDN